MKKRRTFKPAFDALERIAAPVGITPVNPTLLPVGYPTTLPTGALPVIYSPAAPSPTGPGY
jgi:hypothetical protein